MKSPFLHDEIEVKKNFLKLARDFSASGEIEKELAAVMLYTNLCEYLAFHLLESLKQVIFSGSKAFWNGTVYYDARSVDQKLTIGQTARELEKYGFPSKELIVPVLRRIAENRNKVMHNMLRLPGERLPEIGDAVKKIVDDSEELVSLIDDIYRGMPPTNITSSIASGESEEVEGVVDNEGELTIKEKQSDESKKKK